MQIFYQPLLPNSPFHLDIDESKHCIKVLRHKEGDIITLVDGRGGWYKGKISSADHKKCLFEIVEKKQTPPLTYYIHLVICPTKNTDRMEWFVEKAVEIGIDEISFMYTKQSERRVFKTDRVIRKAIGAMKQSIKASMPTINPPKPFHELLSGLKPIQNKFIAYVDGDNPVTLMGSAQPNGNYCVMVGPEGDFTKDELNDAIKHGFSKVSLGKSRLRTETAGIVACHILNLINSECSIS